MGGGRGVAGRRFGDVWRWPELKRATFWFWMGPVPGRLASHKAGWGLRIMAAEGRGGRQLANSAPICFHERGEEISEDAMPERHARRQKGRLKIKLVNILPVSPHDAHFSAGGGGGNDCDGHSHYKKKKSLQLIRRSHVSPPEARSAHTDVAWSVLSYFPSSPFLSPPCMHILFSHPKHIVNLKCKWLPLPPPLFSVFFPYLQSLCL